MTKSQTDLRNCLKLMSGGGDRETKFWVRECTPYCYRMTNEKTESENKRMSTKSRVGGLGRISIPSNTMRRRDFGGQRG